MPRRPEWRVHPLAAEMGGYAVIPLRRLTLGGKVRRVGDVVIICGQHDLKVAANLCRGGAARPADERTRLDVDLLLALRKTDTSHEVAVSPGMLAQPD